MSSIAPYCGAPPHPSEILSRWNLDPVLIGVLLIAGLACLRLTHSSQRKWIVLGWAVLVVCFVSPLCAMTSALFSARASHHVLLIAVAAPLIAMGLRRDVGAPLWLMTLVHIGAIWAWHVPAAYSAALSSDIVYWLMQLALLVSAIAMWAGALARPAPASLVALLAVMTQMGVIGAVLTFAPSLLYRDHLVTTWSWGITALEDQQLGGLVMWAVSLPLYAAAAALLAVRQLAPAMRGTPA